MFTELTLAFLLGIDLFTTIVTACITEDDGGYSYSMPSPTVFF